MDPIDIQPLIVGKLSTILGEKNVFNRACKIRSDLVNTKFISLNINNRVNRVVEMTVTNSVKISLVLRK